MLGAFQESYLTLVKICALFCMLIMSYSLYDHLTRKRKARRQAKRAGQIRKILEQYAEPSKAKQKRQSRRLMRWLKNPMGLLALVTAMDEMGWTDSSKITPQTRWMLCDLLTELYIKVYRKTEIYVQGLLINLLIRCDASSSRLKQILLKCLESNQPLLRVEALRCICGQRNRKMLILALERISREPLPFSNKLITDTLMTFQGNSERLMEELWQALPGYSPEIQVTVLQAIAAMDGSAYAERVLAMVRNTKVDMEVRIAAIKYFGTIEAPECVPVLAQMLSAETWEYAAVAAKILEKYDCCSVFQELKQGICSRNWYVRSNCARTIVHACDPQQIREAMLVDDRYGRDSVRYAMEMARKEEVAV